MKIIQSSFFKVLFSCLLLILLMLNSFIISSTVETEESLDKYLTQKEWIGLCETGLRQSPVNIVYNGNTVEDKSKVEIDYKLPAKSENLKFKYDGSSLYLDIKLGDIKFHNSKGTIETYSSHRIELHFPAEHYVTYAKQTPRSAVELQIHHTKTKEEEKEKKDNSDDETSIRTNRAVISILFKEGESIEGDMFFNQMGISMYNLDKSGEYNIPKPNEEINRINVTPASFNTGFNYIAFKGLIYVLTSDYHVTFYYGSETSPPCREDVLWIVYPKPRSISQAQFDFLNKLIAKPRKKEDENKISSHKQLYGNKRDLQRYNEYLRGKILSNQFGLIVNTPMSFFDEDPNA